MALSRIMDKSGTSTFLAAAIVLLTSALVTGVLLYRRQRTSSSKGSGVSSTRPRHDVTRTTTSSDDAWEERRKRGISLSTSAASTNVQESKDDKKPFSSSYYYAHNNPLAKGGYKDGLRMEDYTMNQPRLLRRGGKPVDSNPMEANNQQEVEPSPAAEALTPSGPSSTTAVLAGGELDRRDSRDNKKRTLAISRYLWDDPGDSKGIACILIDSLPGKVSTSAPLAWKDLTLDQLSISAQLEGDSGLLVMIETLDDDVDYRLHIPRLYGPVASVTTTTTKKRLAIRLQKKYGLFSNRSNLQAWPNPHKKVQ